MSSAWLKATAITLIVALVSWSLGQFATGRFTWGSPELPKAQCEALDAASLANAGTSPLARLYAQRVEAAIVRESQNTWSNLGFVFCGALIFFHDRRVLSRFLGAALVALGLASGIYHASLLPHWRTLDVAMMGWTIVALGLCGIFSLRQRFSSWQSRLPSSPLGLALVSALAGTVAILAAVFRNDVRVAGIKPFDSTYTTVTGVIVIALLLLGSFAFSVRPRPIARVTLLGATVTAAVLCQLLDHPGFCFCQPGSPVQAHAVWHLLMATAGAMAYDLFAMADGQPQLIRHAI